MSRASAAAIAAALLLQACGFLRGAGEMSCQERCRYDYHFCVQESPAGVAQVTFTFSPSTKSSDLMKNNCHQKHAACIARCEGKPYAQ